MSRDNGFIKLHRKICDNPIWNTKPFSKGQAWVDLLLLANFSERDLVVDNTQIHVERGQVFRAIHTLEERWGWSRKRVRSFLGLLEGLNMVTTKGTKKGTLITIENWQVYQVEGPKKRPTKGKDKGPDEGQIRAKSGPYTRMIKKDKNIEPHIVPLLEKLPKEVWDTFVDFMEMRKKIKKSMTDRAVTIAVNKLNDLSGGNPQKAVAILEQSILNNWQSLYELKETSKSDQGRCCT